MKRKSKTFEQAFTAIQKMIMAAMLINNEVERVKYILHSYNVQYTDDLAEDIKAKYGKKSR